MSKQLYVKMDTEFLVEGITATELVIYFNRFIAQSELVSQSGRTTPIEIVESSIKSITGFDDDGGEVEYLDANGGLQDTTGIDKAIKEGLIGEALV